MPKKKDEKSAKINKTVDEIRREQGRIVAALSTATGEQRAALFAAFATLGWVVSDGFENPLRTALERNKWDEAREKNEKDGPTSTQPG